MLALEHILAGHRNFSTEFFILKRGAYYPRAMPSEGPNVETELSFTMGF